MFKKLFCLHAFLYRINCMYSGMDFVEGLCQKCGKKIGKQSLGKK